MKGPSLTLPHLIFSLSPPVNPKSSLSLLPHLTLSVVYERQRLAQHAGTPRRRAKGETHPNLFSPRRLCSGRVRQQHVEAVKRHVHNLETGRTVGPSKLRAPAHVPREPSPLVTRDAVCRSSTADPQEARELLKLVRRVWLSTRKPYPVTHRQQPHTAPLSLPLPVTCCHLKSLSTRHPPGDDEAQPHTVPVPLPLLPPPLPLVRSPPLLLGCSGSIRTRRA